MASHQFVLAVGAEVDDMSDDCKSVVILLLRVVADPVNSIQACGIALLAHCPTTTMW